MQARPRPSRARPRRRALTRARDQHGLARAATLAVTAMAVACAPLEDPRSSTSLALDTRALAASTERTVVVLGRAEGEAPHGAFGAIDAGPPPTAAATFRGVAEGPWIAELLGYARHTFVAPSPEAFPSLAYCLEERGIAAVGVVSGRRSAAVLGASTVLGACTHVALDRVVLDAHYEADAHATWYGAPAGENVARLFLDGFGAGAALTIELDTSTRPSPLGLFTTLPDAAAGWPDESTWTTGQVAVTADANGDALAYLVVKPGTRGAIWEIVVREAGTAVASTRVWIAEVPPVEDCPPWGCGTTVEITASAPTGWASTEGGFNQNHAELRCGDDGRGGAGGYALYPGLTFELGALPAGTVTSAVLHVYEVRVDGDSPFGATMTEVIAEQVRFTNMWEADEVATIAGTIGERLVSSTRDVGWRATPVTEAVTHELSAGRSRVQLRLRFSPSTADGDTAIDWAVFASDDTPAIDQRPYLEVTVE